MRQSTFTFKRAVGFAALVSCIFPYFSFSLNAFDTQPWYIGFCLVFVLAHVRSLKYLPTNLLLISVLIPLSAIVVALFFDDGDDTALRSMASYLGFSLTFLSFLIYKFSFGSLEKFFKICLIIWIVVGFVQLFTDPYLFDYLVNVRTSEARGVTSLSPEPSFFAMVTIVLSLLVFFESNGQPKKSNVLLYVMAIVSVGLVAKSAMGALVIPLAIACAVVQYDFRAKTIFVYISLFAISLAVLSFVITSIPDSRIALTLPLLNDPLNLIGNDLSVATRASYIFFSYYMHIRDFGLPHGFSAFSYEATALAQEFRSFSQIWFHNRIQSAVGSVLFELGVLGYTVILLLWICCRNSATKNSSLATFIRAVSLLAIFSTAIPISFPFFPALLACLYTSSGER